MGGLVAWHVEKLTKARPFSLATCYRDPLETSGLDLFKPSRS